MKKSHTLLQPGGWIQRIRLLGCYNYEEITYRIETVNTSSRPLSISRYNHEEIKYAIGTRAASRTEDSCRVTTMKKLPTLLKGRGHGRTILVGRYNYEEIAYPIETWLVISTVQVAESHNHEEIAYAIER